MSLILSLLLTAPPEVNLCASIAEEIELAVQLGYVTEKQAVSILANCLRYYPE